jgi:hypothetical protein
MSPVYQKVVSDSGTEREAVKLKELWPLVPA